MSSGLKVRVKERIYYIDSIREPGMTSRAGEPQDEFYLEKKEHFNPQFMEAICWVPENNVADLLSTKEDGSHRTAEEVAFIKSDLLDEEIRKARSSKANSEQDDFVKELKKPKKETL